MLHERIGMCNILADFNLSSSNIQKILFNNKHTCRSRNNNTFSFAASVLRFDGHVDLCHLLFMQNFKRIKRNLY